MRTFVGIGNSASPAEVNERDLRICSQESTHRALHKLFWVKNIRIRNRVMACAGQLPGTQHQPRGENRSSHTMTCHDVC